MILCYRVVISLKLSSSISNLAGICDLRIVCRDIVRPSTGSIIEGRGCLRDLDASGGLLLFLRIV